MILRKLTMALAVAALICPLGFSEPVRELGITAEVISIESSPGNAVDAVIATIDSANKEILMAAYSFTSKPIAEALLRAKKRGVSIKIVLDKSQETERYSVATFLKNQGIPFVVCRKYAIMHHKFIIVDAHLVQTGSFNYTASASTRNAENVIVLRSKRFRHSSLMRMQCS